MSAPERLAELAAELAARDRNDPAVSEALAGRSAWRRSAEDLVELTHYVAPTLARQTVTWPQLRAVIPAHLLDLAQRLHATEAARAKVRRPFSSDFEPLDLGPTEVFI